MRRLRPRPIGERRDVLFRLLNPHFELLRVGALEESRHLGGEIGIGSPPSRNLFCQREFGIVRLPEHQLHVALLLNWQLSTRITALDESILPPQCGSLWGHEKADWCAILWRSLRG